MANPKNSSVYHLVINTEEYKKFNRLYPKLLKTFLNRAVKMANDNFAFFTKVYFIDKE